MSQRPSGCRESYKATQDYPRKVKRTKRIFRQREQHVMAKSFERRMHWRFSVAKSQSARGDC